MSTMGTLTTWLASLAVTVAMGAAAEHYDADAYPHGTSADAQDAAALASRAFAAQAVCGPDGTAVWLDDKTLQCLAHGIEAIDPDTVLLAAK